MKKQVLVVFTGAMEIGGIERSLLGLLEAFDYERYAVDLFLYGHHGPLYGQIDKRVNILPEVKELAYLRESLITKIKKGCYYSALLRLRDSIRSKFCEVDHDKTWAEIMRKCTPHLNKKYAMAISFFLPFDYIIEKVDADLKVGWVHTDYRGDPMKRTALFKAYSHMDYIAVVSRQCRDAFAEIFPQLEGRLITIGNILSAAFIKAQADAFPVQEEMAQGKAVKLLSVGRFCEAKNFDNVPFICKLLCERGIDVKWYLVGFGTEEGLIRRNIKSARMESHVVLLGKKENPYPYIKACDLYVQPSRYEGKCVAVIEAQILNKPVVITQYGTAGSQLRNGYDGVIVPQDNEGCARGIAAVLRDKSLQRKLVENTKKEDYTNRREAEKLYRLIMAMGTG